MRSIRISPSAYSRITLMALVVLTIIVITGGAVRVTGSGLGCPDWPQCDSDRIVPPLEYHALVEFVNRVFTGIVVAVVVAGVLASLFRTPRRRDLTWLSISLVIGVLAQAVLGGLSVLFDLSPPFVMGHFLLSMVIIFAAVMLHHRASQPDAPPRAAVHRSFIVLGRLILVLTFAVMVVGTMVTGSGPHAGADDVERLGFDLAHITKVHGALVWLLIAVTAFTAWRLREADASATIVRRAEVLMVALLIQGAIGYLQYSLGVPAWLVLLHIAGATAVWIAAVVFNLHLYERWEPVDIAAYDGFGSPMTVSNPLSSTSSTDKVL